MRTPGLEMSEWEAASVSSADDAARVRRADSDGKRSDLLTMRCVVCDDVALESQDDTHVVVVNTETSARLKLSRGMYRFLQRFDAPRTVEQVVGAEAAVRMLPQLRLLMDKRMLIDADVSPLAPPRRLRSAVAYKFCNAPAYVASSTYSDFVVLGVPYDLGGDLDCRLAPNAIRQKSLDYAYRLGFDDGRPLGLFDAGRSQWMLGGASIADAGDVPVDFGEGQGALFERISAALEETCHDGCVPLLIGGDRSVSYAAIDRLRRRGPLTVMQFAATPACAERDCADSIAADAVATRLLALDGVEGFFSLGANQEAQGLAFEGLVVESAESLQQTGPDEFARRCGERRSVYLSIDLSVTAPAYVRPDRATASPGLRLHEIKALIAALGAAHRIVGIDLVGLDAQGTLPQIRAVAACHLALAAMSAAYDHRGRE